MVASKQLRNTSASIDHMIITCFPFSYSFPFSSLSSSFTFTFPFPFSLSFLKGPDQCRCLSQQNGHINVVNSPPATPKTANQLNKFHVAVNKLHQSC
ncbi:unnamed protein product [Rhizophagus irregularis]|nr:unnamed protein product [Rhizophagus irregularis]